MQQISHLIARFLKERNIERVLRLCGGHILPIWAAELLTVSRRPLVISGRGAKGAGKSLHRFLDVFQCVYLDSAERWKRDYYQPLANQPGLSHFGTVRKLSKRKEPPTGGSFLL